MEPPKKYKKADGTGKTRTHDEFIAGGFKEQQIQDYLKQGILVEVNDEAAPGQQTPAPEKKKESAGSGPSLPETAQTNPSQSPSNGGVKNNSLYNNYDIDFGQNLYTGKKATEVDGKKNTTPAVPIDFGQNYFTANKNDYATIDGQTVDLNKAAASYAPIPTVQLAPDKADQVKTELKARIANNSITKDDADRIAHSNNMDPATVLKAVNTPTSFRVEKAKKEFANLLDETKNISSKNGYSVGINGPEQLAEWQNRIMDPKKAKPDPMISNYEDIIEGTYNSWVTGINKKIGELEADQNNVPTSANMYMTAAQLTKHKDEIAALQNKKDKITEAYKILAADFAAEKAGNNSATASQIYRKYIAPGSYDKEQRYISVNRILSDREQYENDRLGKQIVLEGFAKKAEDLGGNIFNGTAPKELIDDYNKAIDDYNNLPGKYPQVEKNILIRAIEDEMGKRNSDFNTVFKGTKGEMGLAKTFVEVVNDLGIADKARKLGIDYDDIYQNNFLSLFGRSFATTTASAFSFLPRWYKSAEGKSSSMIDAEMERLMERRGNEWVRPDESFVTGVPRRVDTKKLLPDGKPNPSYLKEVENPEAGKDVLNKNTIVGTMADVTGQMASQVLLTYATGGIAKGAIGLGAKLATVGELGVAETALATDIVAAEKISEIHNKIGTFMSGYLTSYEDYKKRANDLITDADGGEDARTLYAMWGASMQGASELILPEYKIARNIKAKFIENAPKIIGAFTKEGIKDLSQASFKQISKDIMYGALNAGDVLLKENIEELATNVSDHVVDSFYKKPTEQSQDFAKDSWDTFLTTTIGTLPTALLGFGGDVKNALMTRSMQQKALLAAGTDPSKYVHIVNNLYDAGQIDKNAYNEKIGIIKTAAKITEEIPLDEKLQKLNPRKQAIYVSNRVAEEQLKQQLANTTDDLAKKRIESNIENLVNERKEILKGTLDYDNDLNAVAPAEVINEEKPDGPVSEGGNGRLPGTNLFNKDNPLAEREIHGINYKIAEGEVKNKKKTYDLYKQDEQVGTFDSVDEAKDHVKEISKDDVDLAKRILAKKAKNYSDKISLPELEAQALQAPASLMNQFKGDEKLTTDLIARNTPEKITEAIDYQQQRLTEPNIGEKDIEEIDQHTQLLEKGLLKSQEGNIADTNTNDNGNEEKKASPEKAKGKEKGDVLTADDEAAAGKAGAAPSIEKPVIDKKNVSEFGNPVKYLDKTVQEVNENFENTSYNYDSQINPLVKQQGQLEKKVKGAKGSEKVTAQQELDAVDTKLNELQQKQSNEQVKFENSLEEVIRHYAVPAGVDEKDMSALYDQVATELFDNAGREKNWNKKMIDVINDNIKEFSSSKTNANETDQNNRSRSGQGGESIGSSVNSKKDRTSGQGSEKGQRDSNNVQKGEAPVTQKDDTGGQQRNEGEAGTGTVNSPAELKSSFEKFSDTKRPYELNKNDRFVDYETEKRGKVIEKKKSDITAIKYDGQNGLTDTRIDREHLMLESEYDGLKELGLSDIDFKIMATVHTRMQPWHNEHIRANNYFNKEELKRYDELSDMLETVEEEPAPYKPKAGEAIYDTKKQKSGIVKNVYKPRKGSALDGKEDYVMDVRYHDGTGAMSMPIDQERYEFPEKPGAVAKDSGITEVDPKEVKRQMQPITDKMASIEEEFRNRGYNIDWDYDNEITVADKDGELVEPEAIPEDLQKPAADYEKATQQLGEFDEKVFKESLNNSREKIKGEYTQAEEVKKPELAAPKKELSAEDKKKAALQKAKEDFAASLKKSRGQLNVNPIDPETLANGVKLMAAYIDLGIYKFGEVVKDMAETLGEKTQDFLDAMKGVYGAYLAQNDIPEMDDLKTVRAFTLDDIDNTKNTDNGNAEDTAVSNPVRTNTSPVANNERAESLEGTLPSEQVEGLPGQESGLGQQDVSAADRSGKKRGGGRGNSNANNTGTTSGGSNPTSKTPARINTADKAELELKTIPENPADRNFHIGKDDVIVPEGNTAKADANMNAVLLLKQLEDENRNPTPEEKLVLGKFTGWGGLASYLETPGYYEESLLNNIINGEEYTTGYGSRKIELPAGEKLNFTGQTFDQVAKTIQSKYNQLIKQYPSLINSVESSLTLDKARRFAIKYLLTPEEHQAATVSTENAHYTQRDIISTTWDLVRDLGFNGGKVIESSMGVGHFFGLMPLNMAVKSDLSGVELDSLTGRIAKKLYPESNIQVKGFQETNFKNNSFDLAISNVPFASTGRVSDEKNKDIENFNLHNYFIAKNLRLLKPGGIAVMITSKSTMDSISSEARRWFYKPEGGNSELIGAIRLPNNAFEKNAGTQVTTDLLVFQKRKDNIVREVNPFVNIELLRSKMIDNELAEIQLNQYYIAHPENMIGDMMFAEEVGAGGLYGKSDATLHAKKGVNVMERMKELVQTFPKDIFDKSIADNPELKTTVATNEKTGKLFTANNKFYVSAGEEAEEAVFDKPAQKLIAKDYIGVRDNIQNIILKEQQPETTDEELKNLREDLNKKYDAFVKKHGSLAKNSFLYDVDIDYSLAASVENVDKKTIFENNRTKRLVEVSKSDIFNKRINFPRTEPQTATDLASAIQVSMAYRNHVNTDYIAKMLGTSPEQAKADMLKQTLAYENPANGLLETPEEYLSGNVRQKLHAAEQISLEDKAFLKNVDALKNVVPEDLPASVIGFKMGVAWLPAQVYKDFINDTLGVNINLNYLPSAGRWIINDKDGQGYRDTRNTNTYAVGSTTGIDIIKDVMNNRPTIITREERNPDGSKRTVRDEVLTASAQDMQNKITDEFTRYVKTNDNYRQVLEKNYNEKFNSIIDRKFNLPVFETFPGANPNIKLRVHQKKGALRAINENTYLAHSVGTGKTYTMATIAMEMRRLGIAKKPLIAVHNATVNGFANQFQKLYPGAKLLVASTLDKGAQNRRKFFGKIASGDWDAVIIPQSQIQMIPDNPERIEHFINEKIEEIQAVLDSMDSSSKGEFYIRKQLEKEIEALREEVDDLYADDVEELTADGEPAKKKKGGKSKVKSEAERISKIKARIQKQARRRTDNVINFDDLGVDAIMIDEAHEYKKLGFSTGQQNIRGIDVGASKRALSALLKIRSVKDRTGGKNAIMASGTPITNTMAEAWTAMRFIAPEMLDDMGIQTFDQFSSTFAQIIPSLEQNAGGKFEVVSRLAKFNNVPELVAAFRKIADVVTNEDVPEYVSDPDNAPPQMKGGKIQSEIVPITEPQRRLMRKISDQYADYKNMSGKEKKEKSWIPLVLYGIGQKGAIDLRLVYPDGVDDPNSKVNKMVKNVVDNYFTYDQYKGTQMIFSDSFNSIDAPSSKALLGIPGSESKFNLYADIKRKLVESGIPENEIIVLSDAKYSNKETKQKAFDMMNDGVIRVAIGSTDKMGVGVNAHERMVGLHHVDAPPRPDQFEQRNGRILRPGNMFTKLGMPVNVYAYGVEGTRDATAFDRLKTKQKFINQIMKGDVKSSEREIDDPFGEESTNTDDFFAEMGATLSGSKHATHLIFAEKELRSERNREFSFKQKQIDTNYKLRNKQSEIANLRKSLEEVIKEAKVAADAFGEGKVKTITIAGKEYKEKLADTLQSRITESENKIKKDDKLTTDSFPIEVNGVIAKVEIIKEKNWGAAKEDPAYEIAHYISIKDIGLNQKQGANARGLLQVVNNYIDPEVMQGQPDRYRNNISREEKNIERLKADLQQEYDYDKLNKLEEKVEGLKKEVLAESAAQEKKEKEERELEKNAAAGLAGKEGDLDKQIEEAKDDLRKTDGNLYSTIVPIPPMLPKLLKLAFLYARKGLKTVGQFANAIGAKINEVLVKAWNQGREEFKKWYYENRNVPKDNNIDTVEKALNHVINNKNAYSEMAKTVLDYADKNSLNVKIKVIPESDWKNEETAGHYIPTSDVIEINEKYFDDARVLLHEVIHAVTAKKLSVNKTSNKTGAEYLRAMNEAYYKDGINKGEKELHDLYLEAAKELGYYDALFNYDNGFANVFDEKRRQTEKIPYGFLNLDEFLAETFSNSAFQEQLKSISTNDRFSKTLWEKFVRAIKNILGIAVKDNVFEKVLEVSKGIMSNTDRSRGTKTPLNANAGPQSRMQKIAQMRADAKDNFEKMFKQFEIKHFGDETLTDKDFNRKTTAVNQVLNVVNSVQQNTAGKVSNKVSEKAKRLAEKGLQSKNKLFRTIAKTINSIFANAGKNHEDILASEKFAGEGKVRSVADSVHLDKQLRELIDNNANSLMRIQQVLDPEFYQEMDQDQFNEAIENEVGQEDFEKIKQDDLINRYKAYREEMGFDEPDYKPMTYEDLSPEEKKAYDAIRFTYDMMHELNFYLGKLTPETYEANKGVYSARLYKAYEIPEETKQLFKSSPYKLDESLYQARTDINEWKLFNRLADPIYAVTKRLQQTMANKAIIDYADYIYKNKPDAVSPIEKKGYRKLKLGYGSLSNKFVRDDIAEDFIGYFYASEGMQHFYDFVKKYDKLPLRQFYKKLFTVYNPATHTGNITGNVVFAAITGISPVRLIGNVPWALKQAKEYSSEYRYLLSNGVLGSDFTKEDLVKSITELEKNIAGAAKSKNPFKYVSEKLQNFYSGTDDIFKIAAFKSLLDLGNTPKTAADKVKEGFQNYKRVGKSYDLFSKIPLIGNPFGKFAGDVARITKNGITSHPLSTIAFLMSIKFMADWASKLSGESDEDKKIRMARKGMPKIPFPEWAGGDIPLAFKIGDQEWNVARFLSPAFTYGSGDGDDNYEFFSKMLPQNVEVPDWTEMDKGRGLNIFLSKNANDPLLAPLVQILANSDFRGAPIIDPAETKYKPSAISTEEKIKNLSNFLARGYIPYYSTGNDFVNAVGGDKDYYGRDRKPWQVIVSFLGVTPKITEFPDTRYGQILEQKMDNYGFQFQTQARIINTIAKEYKEGKISYEIFKERTADHLQTQAEIKQKADKEYKELTGKVSGVDLKKRDITTGEKTKKRKESF